MCSSTVAHALLAGLILLLECCRVCAVPSAISGDDAHGDGQMLGRVAELEKELQSDAELPATALGTGASSPLTGVPGEAKASVPAWLISYPGLSLEESVRFPGSETCGVWHEDYTELHNQIRANTRAGKEAGRYITWSCGTKESPRGCQGLGDQLVGLVSTFVAALLTRRAIIIHAPALESAFEPAEVDWRLDEGVPLEAKYEQRLLHLDPPLRKIKKGSVVRLIARNSKLINGSNVMFPRDPLDFFSKLDNARNIIVNTNGGILTIVYFEETPTRKALEAMGLRLPSAFGCVLRYLLQPTREVLQLAEPYVSEFQKPNKAVVGMQVRMSDCINWGSDVAENKAQDKNKCGFKRSEDELEAATTAAESVMFGCAKKITDYWVPLGVKVVYLFLSNSMVLKKLIKDKYGDSIMTTETVPVHTAQSGAKQMQQTVAEWLTLSWSHFFVISESGFSKTAYAYNLKSPPVFLFGRMDMPPFERPCDPSHPQSLFDFRHWSGL